MEEITTAQLVGAWVSIFLTLCIFSYLYGDNPVYKFAEHLFLGVSVGVATSAQFYGAIKPNLLDQVFVSDLSELNWPRLCALALLVMLFLRYGPKQISWLARIPIAFIVAAFAGLKLTGEAQSNLITQVGGTIPNLREVYEQHQLVDVNADFAGVFSAVFLALGLAAALLHFYFSAPHNPAMRVVSRFGVLVLMLSFGASFGFTVMGRISLAIGRFQEMFGYDKPDAVAAAIQPQTATLVSLIIIVSILVVWQRFGGDGDDEDEVAA